MPNSAAAATVRRTASAPRRCPAMRGRPRALAHRPLPSMMTATWAGGGGMGEDRTFSMGSDLKDLLVLLRQHIVDLLDRLVGQMLDVALQLAMLILRDRAALLLLLQEIKPVAAHIAHGDAPLLGIFGGDSGQLPAPLLVEIGDGHADRLAFGLRIEAEPGLADRLLRRLDDAAIPDLHDDEPGLRHADRSNLVERHRVAIGFDGDGIEEARRGAPRTQTGELLAQRLEGAVHAAPEVGDDLCFAHGSSLIRSRW